MSNVRRGVVAVGSLVVAAWVASGAATAEAQVVKPFKISGYGVGPTGLPLPGQPPRPHWIDGEATHLGRHHGEGTVRTLTADVDFAAGVITGRFGSGQPFVFTGANGDQLACDYGDQGHGEFGVFELTILGFTDEGYLIVEALWLAEFVARPAQSTGRFAGVTGSWIMVARSRPFVLGSELPAAYWWQGDGQLTFRRK